MPSTMPLRVGDDLLASAKLAAEATGRSAAQQIGYWAKLGRELERSGTVSVREVAEVLAGARSYDDLAAKSQAAVRAEWDARIEARREALNLAERFAAEGRSWVEAGPDGVPVRRSAPDGGTRQRRRAPRKDQQAGATTARTDRATGASTKKTEVTKKAAAKKTPARRR
jgi:ParD-like antitoxin of type II bacterial toxin-antitoxin system